MSIYMTEAEQIESIKNWWRRYSNMITVLFSILLLVMAGVRYWHWHAAKIEQQASNAYEHMMVAFSNQDRKGVRGYANQLIKEYRHTVYADAARLTLARLYVEHAHYDKAKVQLNHVANKGNMPALQHVAIIRMARLLLAEKSYDQALTTLEKMTDEGYQPVVSELKGDIYTAMGEYPKAVRSYREALTQAKTQGMGNLFLEMKANELSALT